jgi:hypothetical protein
MQQPLEPLSLALLGTIAVLSVLQGLLLLGAAWSAFRAVRRAEDVAGRVGGALQPAVRDLTRATQHAADVSEQVARQARRLDVLVTDAVDSVERAQRAVQGLLPIAGRVAGVASVLRLLRSGVRAVRRLRG